MYFRKVTYPTLLILIKDYSASVRGANLSSTKDPQCVRGSEIFYVFWSTSRPVRNVHISVDDAADAIDLNNDVCLTCVSLQCSASCDDGLRWRDLYCYDRGQLVSPTECDHTVTPPSSQPCNLQPCRPSMCLKHSDSRQLQTAKLSLFYSKTFVTLSRSIKTYMY